jgi:hypothetical protein
MAPIIAGQHTANEATVDAPGRGLRVLRPWSWQEAGDGVEFLGRLGIPPVALSRLTVVNSSAAQVLQLRALTLIDDRDGATTSLVLDDRLERAAFFDMKVYEYPAVLPRAHLVHRVVELGDSDGLALLAERSFDPREVAIVEPGSAVRAEADLRDSARVTVTRREAETLEVVTRSDTTALLVLSEAYYPGWEARVDDVLAPIVRTNVMFRGVAVPAGEHTVRLTYRPTSFFVGLVVSAVSLLCCGLLVRRRRA